MSADPTPTRPQLVIPPGMPTVAPVPVSHEAELISALLDTGSYNPAAYGVHSSAFRGLGALNDFCSTYQSHGGVAPPLHVVHSRFPSFTYVPGVSPSWAAHNVLDDETSRALRKGMQKAASSVNDEAYGEAIGILRETVTTLSTASTPGRLVTDFSQTRAVADTDICPIPPGRLADLTGGHHAGQLWFMAALWGVGKTWKLVQHAVCAAANGWDVVFFSLEMPTEEILFRLRQIVLHHLGPLPLVDLDIQERAMAEWAEEAGGRLEVRGPDTGRVDAGTVAGAVNSEHTLVVIDYVGKMFTTDGRHARSGHEPMALVSAELQQTGGLLKVPILGAAQINRKGELAGTIALEQDSDLIVHQTKIADNVNGVRKNAIYKTRHTEMPPPWYSRFAPATADFGDITHDEAMALRMAEEATAWA